MYADRRIRDKPHYENANDSISCFFFTIVTNLLRAKNRVLMSWTSKHDLVKIWGKG